MDISVIIPTYKPGNYIWECLDSLKNQTFQKDRFEVILVLNGCNEPYYSEIQDYMTRNDDSLKIHFIQTDQGGVSRARNIALDVAKGEYIAFIDDDDWVSPNYLEGLYAGIDENTITIAYPYAFNDGDISTQLPYSLTEAYDSFDRSVEYTISSKVRKFFSGPCMKLIPSRIIGDRRFDTRLKNGEDVLFMFLISDRFKKIRISIDKAVYYRRFRMNSATTSHRDYAKNAYDNIFSINLLYRYYLRNILKYNFIFFITRILGGFYSLVSGKY